MAAHHRITFVSVIEHLGAQVQEEILNTGDSIWLSNVNDPAETFKDKWSDLDPLYEDFKNNYFMQFFLHIPEPTLTFLVILTYVVFFFLLRSGLFV